MKVLLFLMAASAFVFFACSPKSSKKAETAETTAPPNPKPAEEELPVGKEDEIAGYEKTACFGKCPVYRVRFYADGRVSWYGRMNVERMGWHSAKVPPEVIKGIQDKAREIGYFNFLGEYPVGKKVADLPATITFIRMEDMMKQVVDQHEAPDSLKAFEKYLEDLIAGLKWEPMTRQ
jgi:hypothetical protein